MFSRFVWVPSVIAALTIFTGCGSDSTDPLRDYKHLEANFIKPVGVETSSQQMREPGWLAVSRDVADFEDFTIVGRVGEKLQEKLVLGAAYSASDYEIISISPLRDEKTDVEQQALGKPSFTRDSSAHDRPAFQVRTNQPLNDGSKILRFDVIIRPVCSNCAGEVNSQTHVLSFRVVAIAPIPARGN